ncbi:cytochrome c oxidase assembly factor 7-like [Acanthaster planci]|uniref:Cytochrome c oxidase assembly factor 7-like n=1 Tax=Acanthaster planci TaxID=133434 RepID=A0A8B7Y6E5_ACAPL|nr:cytochrome c oxidase assembly factor 7-like [Acanthaster planci]
MNAVNFKSEEEVKEYLANLETEYNYQCYREKSGEGCYRLGEFYAGIRGDLSKAAPAYATSCNTYSHAVSCNKLAALHLYGKGVDKDRRKAVDYFVKSCEGGYLTGCYGAGVALSGGDTEDPPQAAAFLQRACEGDHQEGCFQLGGVYLRGLGAVEKDLAKAFHYTLRSCQLGQMYGCANVSRMYRLGDGTAKDEKLAEEYKAKAKELHRQAKEKAAQLKFGETGGK